MRPYQRLFETYDRKSILRPVFNKIQKAKLGSIFKESEVYTYVEYLHTKSEDFYEGNLGESIEKYPSYILREIPLNSIDAPWDVDESKVDAYADIDTKIPPIVVTHDFEIIDGMHRFEVAKIKGQTTIKALVGKRK
jgi:hypothetical protein